MRQINEVHKVGGATLENGCGFQKVGQIFTDMPKDKNIIIVPSAVRGMTTHLESVHKTWKSGGGMAKQLAGFRKTHIDITEDIFPLAYHKGMEKLLSGLLCSDGGLRYALDHAKSPDMTRAALLAVGEDASALLLSKYFEVVRKLPVALVDARKVIWTTGNHVNAKVNAELSKRRIATVVQSIPLIYRFIMIPGFIGSNTTTLKTAVMERDTSDVTAQIVGEAVSAEKVVFWKRVPGVFAENTLLSRMTYTQIIEYLLAQLAIEAAKPKKERKPPLLHLDAVKGLAATRIPFVIRSSENLECPGTLVS